MRDEAYEIYKRQVLGRELYTSDEDNKRVKDLGAEYGKWESLHGDQRRVTPLGPAHTKTAKDQDRWLKEMDVHAADPKRRAEMQYAAQHGLDYPLKKRPASVKRKEMAVSKSAFGVDHEEIIKWNPVSAVGQAIMAARKPAAAGKHAVATTSQRAGNIARNAPKPGQTSAAQVGARRAAMVSPRANPVAAVPKPPAATSVNVAPSSGTQAISLNRGNSGPTPSPKPKSGSNGKKKGEGKNGGGFTEWAKTNSLSRNLALGAGIGGVGAMGYGAAKLDGRN